MQRQKINKKLPLNGISCREQKYYSFVHLHYMFCAMKINES